MAESQFNSGLGDDRLLRSALGPSADCLTVETLAAVAETLAATKTRLDNESMATAMAHLQSCTHCRNEAALLMEFQTATPRPDELESVAWIESRLCASALLSNPLTPSASISSALTSSTLTSSTLIPSTLSPSAPRSTARRVTAESGRSGRTRGSIAGWLEQAFAFRRWQTMNRQYAVLAAACLLFLVAGGVYLRPGPAILRPVGIGEQVWRSLQVTAVSPAGDIAGAPSELKWDSVPGAARYVASVLEVDRTEIWKGESTSSSATIGLELPENLRHQMTPGRTFLWSVAAQDAAGRTLSESSLQSFHITATVR